MSVVIPARNEASAIGDCLRSVRHQTYDELEIIVVDDGSTDGTADVVANHAREDPRVQLVHHSAGSIPISLNLGLAAARGRWLVRIDAHSTIPPSYVELAVDRLSTGRWGGVGGRKEGAACSRTGQAIAAALGSPFGVGNSLYHYGTSATTVDHIPFGAYPVDLLRAVGGWDQRLAVNEDYELDYRIRQRGRTLLFDPELVIRWQNRETLRDLWRQYMRYGRGKAAAVRLQPGTLRPRHVVAPLFVATIIGGALIAPWNLTPIAATALAYVIGVAVASVSASERLPDAPTVAAAFIVMHVGWGLGFLLGLSPTYSEVRSRTRSHKARV